MSTIRAFVCLFVCAVSLCAVGRPSAAEIAAAVRQTKLDADETYRVRELELSRGDLKLYLTEGILSFFTPVDGKQIAAVFTTAGVEAGDAELLLLPPDRSERASLASFAKTPNLDEHLTSVLLLFSDDTADELKAQIAERPVHKDREIADKIAPEMNTIMRDASGQIDLRLIQSLLDAHEPRQGFLYAIALGRTVGPLDVAYEPDAFEPISVGRLGPTQDGNNVFQVWTSFRPRRAAPYVPPSPRQSDYRIDANIHPDLTMAVTAHFQMRVEPRDGRVLSFALSDHLTLTQALIDGRPAEFFQRKGEGSSELSSPGTFLLISDAPLTPGEDHQIEVRYEGAVIRQASDGSYFVDDRNAWFPVNGTTLSQFDLTFHCPDALRLVSTGELIGDQTEHGIRTVHRKTENPERLAGFNLGHYAVAGRNGGPYRVDCYTDTASEKPELDLSSATVAILEEYTKRWVPLPLHSLAISPISGYFGQGFPGLIYLSNIAYLKPEDRPASVRNARSDLFFSDLLLPHEVAHQWWGNMVAAATYRSAWLMEAMANYSALQFVERKNGLEAVNAVLDRYREDLLHVEDGKTVESSGPVDFGLRLLENTNPTVWRVIVYEKGTWILHMLRMRMGEDNFERMQVALLRDFAARPLTNEDFRKLASRFIPGDQPDRDLSLFFETWVYGTGIPDLSLTTSKQQSRLTVRGVSDDFSVDVPLQCGSGIRWIRATGGSDAADVPKSCDLPPSGQFLYIR